MEARQNPAVPGLYDPRFEHDNCGIGAVANIKGIRSHKTVDQALHIVENLEHRAGKDAEGKTGDGVGIMLQISHKFFKKAVRPLGIQLSGAGEYGVGMFFFPQDELSRNQAKKMFEIIVKKEGLTFLGWREVPNHPEVLGKRAVDVMPYIAQGFVAKPADVKAGLDFDRKLYVVRRVFELKAMVLNGEYTELPPFSVSDSACRDHWNTYCIHHLRHKSHSRDLADMSSCLCSFCYHRIGAAALHTLCKS